MIFSESHMQTDILFIIFFENMDDISQHRVTYMGYTFSVEFWDGPYYRLQCFSCALFGISGARRPGDTCLSISYYMCLVCFPLINDIAWVLEGGREQKPWYFVSGRWHLGFSRCEVLHPQCLLETIWKSPTLMLQAAVTIRHWFPGVSDLVETCWVSKGWSGDPES